VPADERVVALVAEQDVAAAEPAQRVVAGEALDAVRQARAAQVVVARQAGDRREAGLDRRGRARAGAAGQADRRDALARAAR